MTAIETAPPAGHVAEFSRVVRVMRLHLVNRMTYLGIPWIITGFALFVSIVVAFLIAAASSGTDLEAAFRGMTYSWAVASPLWYLAVVGIQSVGTTFPFALGLSITRREFALGTALTFVVISAFNATAWTLLTEVERVTDGFGTGFHHFTAMWFGALAAGGVWLSWFALQLAIFAIGAGFAAVWLRWRAFGVVAVWAAIVLVGLALISIVVLTGGVGAVTEWFAGITLTGLFAGLLIPALIALAGGWVVLRKATAR